MTQNRYYHTASVLTNGYVLVTDGRSLLVSADATKLYNPVTGLWTSTMSMMYVREQHAASLLSDGRVLVTGGTDSSFSSFNTAELFNPSTGTWTMTTNMTYARYRHTASVLPSGQVLPVGGVDTYIATELYDSVT